MLNMFRTYTYPSSIACDCAVELPHLSFFSVRCVLGFGAAGFEWCPCYRLQPATRTPLKPTITVVVIQQQSRNLLVMNILVFETCWVHTKWNKIASDIKLVFYSSNICLIWFTLFVCICVCVCVCVCLCVCLCVCVCNIALKWRENP